MIPLMPSPGKPNTFTVHIPWDEAFVRAVWPAAEVNRDYLLMVVAVLATSISPYLFAASNVARPRRWAGEKYTAEK
jgi:hypothetical protein